MPPGHGGGGAKTRPGRIKAEKYFTLLGGTQPDLASTQFLWMRVPFQRKTSHWKCGSAHEKRLQNWLESRFSELPQEDAPAPLTLELTPRLTIVPKPIGTLG